jgi:putative MFS transporter
MFEILDRRTSLTGNQIKILSAAIIGDALEFFDYFLIGFVLAFLIGPWKLTFGQSAIVLMSSGIGAILGAYIWGWLADKIGRRKVFIGTVLNFSIATGLLYFSPTMAGSISPSCASSWAWAWAGFIAWTCPWCRSSCPPPSAAG